jgi:pimeloyl-ACP methyl ester carboxylesterase
VVWLNQHERNVVWLNQHATNNSLIVFIHGFLGDFRSWQEFLTFFQGVRHQRPWSSYDVLSFEYPTRMYSQPPLRPSVIRQLDSLLLDERVLQRFETIILIGHSQGGVLAKLYLLEKLREGLGREVKIDMIITVCTPHRGPRFPYSLMLDSLRVLERVPFLESVLPFRQARDLCRDGQNAVMLRDYWRHPFVSSVPCEASAQCRYVRSIALVGRNDAFVSERSARGISGLDELRYVESGHSIDSEELQQPLFEYLDTHAPPVEVVNRLSELNSEAGLLAYRAQYYSVVEHAVRRFVSQAGGPNSEEYIQARATTLLSEFPFDFVRRPLRKLNFDEALQTYVKRRLESML